MLHLGREGPHYYTASLSVHGEETFASLKSGRIRHLRPYRQTFLTSAPDFLSSVGHRAIYTTRQQQSG